jgi:hypothetical protein
MTLRTLAKFAAAVLTITALHTALAHADPDDDDPGYSTIDGGAQQGQETWPSICSAATAPLACGLHFNPGPNTWTRPAPEPAH